MKNIIYSIVGLIVFASSLFAQASYPDNEDGSFEDMLTPQYYKSSSGHPFRNEVNKFVHFARMEQFRHPLEDAAGQKPRFAIPLHGQFGAGKGPGGTTQHHPAIDCHVASNATDVTLYAAHDGYVQVFRDAPKYRHYLSITRNVTDSSENILGKMVTLYAHLDLDLDSAENRIMHGKFVQKGDVVSTHLYSGTVGGPHLHFEIRYYRAGDSGKEEYYGFVGPGGSTVLTELSAGSWQYGYWNPDTGYGFANPENHFRSSPTGIEREYEPGQIEFELFQNYPNPFNPSTTIRYSVSHRTNVRIEVLDLHGAIVAVLEDGLRNAGEYSVVFDGSGHPSGLYFCNMITDRAEARWTMLLVK